MCLPMLRMCSYDDVGGGEANLYELQTTCNWKAVCRLKVINVQIPREHLRFMFGLEGIMLISAPFERTSGDCSLRCTMQVHAAHTVETHDFCMYLVVILDFSGLRVRC